MRPLDGASCRLCVSSTVGLTLRLLSLPRLLDPRPSALASTRTHAASRLRWTDQRRPVERSSDRSLVVGLAPRVRA